MADLILFVDDEEQILQSLRRSLEEWLEERGLNMLTAGSVKAALEIVEKQPERFRVVLSDLKMPQQPGTVLLSTIQQRWPAISTILMTGYSEIEEIKNAIHAGIVAFIQKPWETELLQAEISKALELANLRFRNQEYLSSLIHELRWSRQIHHSLLMDDEASRLAPGQSLAYKPAQGIVEGGGDFFQVLWRTDANMGFCIGTIDARGAQSTYFGLKIRDLLKNCVAKLAGHGHQSPARILEALNGAIFAHQIELPGCLLNVSILALNCQDHSATMACAGGESFFIVDAGGVATHHLPSPGLGYKNDLLFHDQSFVLKAGAFMVLASLPFARHPDTLRILESTWERHNTEQAVDAKALLAMVMGDSNAPFDTTVFFLKIPIAETSL